MAKSFSIVDVSFVSFWKILSSLSVKEMRLLNEFTYIFEVFQGCCKGLKKDLHRVLKFLVVLEVVEWYLVSFIFVQYNKGNKIVLMLVSFVLYNSCKMFRVIEEIR